MTSGEQYVMTPGTPLMLLWSADNWDMHTLEVSLASNDGVAECALLTNSNPPGSRAFRNAFFGAGTGPIFLDDVQCSSTSSQLLECSSNPILTHNCLHNADAGVGCEGNFIFVIDVWKLYHTGSRCIVTCIDRKCSHVM